MRQQYCSPPAAVRLTKQPVPFSCFLLPSRLRKGQTVFRDGEDSRLWSPLLGVGDRSFGRGRLNQWAEAGVVPIECDSSILRKMREVRKGRESVVSS